MPQAYAKVWLPDLDNSWEHNQSCPTDYTNNCGGWVWQSNRVARRWSGTQTRARCAGVCSEVIQYASGQTGNPCDGADKIRHINPSENLNGGAKGAIECTFNSIDANKLKTISGNVKNTNSSIDGGGSVYEQLLFGVKVGGYNTENQGFCENANNLEKVVDQNGDTCYKKIVTKLGDAVAKQEAIEYCKIDANKTDPKCKCINVSGGNFVEECRNNPSWAGCSEIIAAADSYASVGVLQSITGLSGGADCLVPGICSGDVYEPQTVPQSCANQIGICDQVLNIDVGKIDEAAELSAFQGCDIQFETVRDRGSSTSGSPSGIPAPFVGGSGTGTGTGGGGGADDSFRSKLPEFLQPYVPLSIDELKTDSQKQLGVGGVGSFFMVCCCLLIILILSTSGGGEGGGPTRFRRR